MKKCYVISIVAILLLLGIVLYGANTSVANNEEIVELHISNEVEIESFIEDLELKGNEVIYVGVYQEEKQSQGVSYSSSNDVSIGRFEPSSLFKSMGVSHSQSVGNTKGVSYSTTVSKSMGVSYSETVGSSQGVSENVGECNFFNWNLSRSE